MELDIETNVAVAAVAYAWLWSFWLSFSWFWRAVVGEYQAITIIWDIVVENLSELIDCVHDFSNKYFHRFWGEGEEEWRINFNDIVEYRFLFCLF